MNRPVVSVIIPTFNRDALLPRAIDSVIAQTESDWEIVLVDDGSTDRTGDVADRYAKALGQRFQYLVQPNRGCGAARNRGIDASRGRFIAFLDSDDEFTPTRLSRQLALFGRCPALGLVYCDYAIVSTDGACEPSAFDSHCMMARRVPCEPIAPRMYECHDGVFDALLREYFIATIAGLVRREVLGDSIRFSEELAYAEEWLFYLRVCRETRAGFIDEPLAIHHHTPGSLARTDRLRNTRRYHDLLLAIREAFPGLNRRQRRIVRANLAKSALQLGYDAQRAGQWSHSVSHFASSLANGPSILAARGGLSSLWKCLAPVAKPPGDSRLSVQEARRGVR